MSGRAKGDPRRPKGQSVGSGEKAKKVFTQSLIRLPSATRDSRGRDLVTRFFNSSPAFPILIVSWYASWNRRFYEKKVELNLTVAGPCREQSVLMSFFEAFDEV